MHHRSNKIPKCNECEKKRVAVIPENYIIISIIEEYGMLFTDGVGSINVSVIKDIVDTYPMDDQEKLETLKLIVLYCKIAKDIGAKT